MKLSRYFLVLAASCAATGVLAQMPVVERPSGNPVQVKSEEDVIQSDRKTMEDTGRSGANTIAVDSFPKGALGDVLRAHMKTINGVSTDKQQKYQDAEKAYQASLRGLRAKGVDVVPLLVRAYESIEVGDYFRRWELVETMRELQEPSAAPALAKIATASVPAERFQTDPERDSVGEEIRIRATAAEALGPLARLDKVAELALLDLAKSPHIGLQRAAIRSYLAAATDEDDQRKRAARLKRIVPSSRYNLLTLETTEVKRVPHPKMPDKFDIKKRRPGEGEPPKVQEYPGLETH